MEGRGLATMDNHTSSRGKRPVLPQKRQNRLILFGQRIQRRKVPKHRRLWTRTCRRRYLHEIETNMPKIFLEHTHKREKEKGMYKIQNSIGLERKIQDLFGHRGAPMHFKTTCPTKRATVHVPVAKCLVRSVKG